MGSLNRRGSRVGEEDDSAISVVVSIEQEIEAERKREDKEEELPRWWEFPNIFFVHLALLPLLHLQGQSTEFDFVLDSVDMGASFGCVVVLSIKVILELKIRDKITSTTRIDAGITLIFFGGMVYEAIIA